jgi:hypothetical protein
LSIGGLAEALWSNCVACSAGLPRRLELLAEHPDPNHRVTAVEAQAGACRFVGDARWYVVYARLSPRGDLAIRLARVIDVADCFALKQ